MYHSWTKHNDVRYHWLRLAIDQQKLKRKKVHTDDSVVDMLTKVVPREKLQLCAKNVGMEMNWETSNLLVWPERGDCWCVWLLFYIIISSNSMRERATNALSLVTPCCSTPQSSNSTIVCENHTFTTPTHGLHHPVFFVSFTHVFASVVVIPFGILPTLCQ